jgi:hypothetical protein
MVNEKLSRYMVYLKNEKFFPKDAHFLLSEARKALPESNVIIRDVRVSGNHLEYDISLGKFEDVEKMKAKLSNIGKFIELYNVVEKEFDKNDAIQLAKNFFNSEKYWNAHEVLEGVWKRTEGEEKKLLNGLILVAAAFVHYQKDETNVFFGIMRRALEKMRNTKGTYFEIEIDSVRKEITDILTSGIVHIFRI